MALSPMMKQYMETKEQHKDTILFYRLGDFYEMFFDDALLASKELELTLTGRDCGLEERAPMCGVPHHAADVYIKKLVDKGYKVAVCEQMEDPKAVKGIVKREVVRIVTPGTITDKDSLEDNKNNYLCCIAMVGSDYGLAFADISTGRCMVTDISKKEAAMDEILKFAPAEIICNETILMGNIDEDAVFNRLNIRPYVLPDMYFDEEAAGRILLEQFRSSRLEGIGLTDFPCGTTAAGALFAYLYETQKNHLAQMNTITPYIAQKYMMLDSFTRRNLELFETLRDKQRKGSLLWILDHTGTAMGARMLRSFIEQPLLDADEINKRLDCIEELNKHQIDRDEIREYLNSIYDLERLTSKVANRSANPRDLIAFRTSLSMLPHIKRLISSLDSELLDRISEDLDTCEDLHELLEASISDDAPLQLKEGGIFKKGYNEKIDEYRDAGQKGKIWLSELEERERNRTGIKTLKVKYNRVFGYYIEVTNSFRHMVPDDYTRKQTLTNAERYSTVELKELEDTILGAEDKLTALEYDLFCEIRDVLFDNISRIQKSAEKIALADAMCSLSYTAVRNRYVRPVLNKDGVIEIKDGRHPVVEKMIDHDMFIPNDMYLDSDENRVAVITGPNMAGKSTYMRQNALIVLMAQLGSFVPASYANIGICDRIFTRVGASDDLASGQSTFMVEMTEVANILRNASADSLLILDEIGRGTSTFDGLSIAWAVTEHIADKKALGAKTLFATHYHELTELEGTLDGVRNFCIAVKEKDDDIVFLRKIIPGGADKSYGIQVAKLAGVPAKVLERAKELAAQLLEADITSKVKDIAESGRTAFNTVSASQYKQLSLFDQPSSDDLAEEIEALDLSNMTPLEALNKLYEFQKKAKSIG